jgi:DNA-binding MarR family transcriptional regulator
LRRIRFPGKYKRRDHSTLPSITDTIHSKTLISFKEDQKLLDLSQFIPYKLAVLSTKIGLAFWPHYGARFDLEVADWRLLSILGQFGPVTAKDVCAFAAMHKTRVSRVISGLEKRRLVQRRVNRRDLREAFLSLTEEGRQMYEEIAPLALAFERDLMEHLSADDRFALEQALQKLSTALDAMSKPVPSA